MKKLSDYLIDEPKRPGDRVKCPLCRQEDSLKLMIPPPDDAELDTHFICVSCGEDGTLQGGWTEREDIERGYSDLSIPKFMDRINHFYENGVERGISTGFKTIDEFYTVRKRELTIFTGIPNHGKSEILDAILMNLAFKYDWKFAIYSPENEPIEEHFKKLAEKYVGKPFFGYNRMSVAEKGAAWDFIRKHFFWVTPKERSLEEILSTTDYLRRKKQVDGVVLDPFNMIEHFRPPHLREDEYIGICLAKMKTFIKKTNLAFWLVVHPRKMGKTDAGKQEVPTPYDLKGSSEYYAMAENIITVWRDILAVDEEDKAKCEIYSHKIRFKATGRAGEMTTLYYNRMNGIYRESPDELNEKTINGGSNV